MAVLSKRCKPDTSELHNSLKHSLTNIRGLCLNFVDCESFLESNSPDILALCKTNLNDSIDSASFSVRDHLPLIRKDCTTHMHGLAVYVKEGLPLSVENSGDSYLCFRLSLLHSVSYFFFLYRSPSLYICTVFDSIFSNIDELLSISNSANVFVFGDFNFPRQDWLTCPSGTDRSSELCYNFLSQTTFLRWLTFLPGSQTVILTVLLFLFLLTVVCVLHWFSIHWKILIMLLSQFPLTFHQIHNGSPRFIAQLMTVLVLIGTVFVIIGEIFRRKICLNSVLLLLLLNCLSGFRLELMYISFMVHSHSFPWFSAACAADSSQKPLLSFALKV